MTRGGKTKERDGAERRCIVSGESGPIAPMVRFVVGPDGAIFPDIAERLPGRGIWVTATRDALEKAIAKKMFSRAARCQVKVADDLVDHVEELLAVRLRELIALSRKAGLALTGFEKVKGRLKQGSVGALVESSDGSPQGQAKLRPLAGGAPVVRSLNKQELGLAFGREFVVHAVLDKGGLTERVLRENQRLEGFRPVSAALDAQDGAVMTESAIGGM